MKEKDIKVGRVYEGKDGTQRKIFDRGMRCRPGTALTEGVTYLRVGDDELNYTNYAHVYVDTFARWAHKEVKP